MASEHARHWLLDPAVDFLNHGSFGATPRPVLQAQNAWREEMEREPVRFFVERHDAELATARDALAAFVGAGPDDLAFVTNATTGCNAVLRSLELAPGDQLLTTDHAYNAVRNAMAHVANRAGARLVTVKVPFPLASADEAVQRILAAVTPRTRLAVLDHVTSATAMRDLLCATTREPPPIPDAMIGSMASVPLGWEDEPASVQGVNLYGDRLHGALLAAGIQVMITPWPQRPEGLRWRRLVRVSAVAYNDRGQMERLAHTLAAALEAAD